MTKEKGQNSKRELRNKFENRNSKLETLSHPTVWSIRRLDFEFVSYFEIPISCFTRPNNIQDSSHGQVCRHIACRW
jgi:hypothetical protein